MSPRGKARATTEQTEPWRSRITGESEEDPASLLANPANWRTHPNRQRDAMRGILREVGWVQRVVVNDRTGHVIDGHLRVEEAISAGAETVPVVHVDLSEDEERLVLATLDPLGAMAGTSEERLRELLGDLSPGDAALQAMLTKMAHDFGDAYTGTINVPRYEPTGENPEPVRLTDETKAESLRKAIEADGSLDASTREFLLTAASRHVVFDYGLIAEFYAHAPASVQRHMEASALVIIDYEDAIRDGYIRFAGALASLAEGDLEDGDGDDGEA